MSTEQGEGSSTSQSKAAQAKHSSDPSNPTELIALPHQSPPPPRSPTASQPISSTSTPSKPADEPQHSDPSTHTPTTTFIPPEEEKAEEQKQQPAAKRDEPSASTSPSTNETTTYAGAGVAGAATAGTSSSASASGGAPRPRQVIAVSASKGPAAFFNLARKFLVTDEMCDLSALEGAIVSAVDAAHLLERSKLATIVKVQTSYVAVEPKRRKQAPLSTHSSPQPTPPLQGMSPVSPAMTESGVPTAGGAPPTPPSHLSLGAAAQQQQPQQPRSSSRRGSSGRELRRARIVITVKRTESYKKWLDDNPLQAIIAGDGEDDPDKAAEAGATDD